MKKHLCHLCHLCNLLVNITLPRYCSACDKRLQLWEQEICVLCLMEMPVSYFHLDEANAVAKVFWGRVRVEQATTWFVYISGSKFGNLLHRLKYENRPKIGVVCGEQYGYQLLHSGVYELPDLIIPIPLHPKRKKTRGYNQSEMIARGLSKAMNRPYSVMHLIRNTNTKTQTAKSRVDRYLNVKGKFDLKNPEELEGKHLLLVDDVITTGATMEACAEVLLEIPNVRVSLLGIAFANKIS